jgi:uracil-DNA glycosylase
MTSDPYNELLDATIRHLEELKAAGATSVPVSPEMLTALREPVRAKASVSPATQLPRQQDARPAQPVAPKQPESKPSAAASEGLRYSLRPAPTPQAKDSAMEALKERVLQCSECSHLAASRKNVVFGAGSLDAELMFVGEAPGADEDRMGEPFVGAAGQLLNKIITAMGLRREQVFIANILKCRPDTPGQTSGNRKPVPSEMATCIPHLQEQIRIIQPKVIVGLGATAMEGLLGKTEGITRARGNWHAYQGTPLMPTYHPAYLLHNQNKTEKRKVWEDMMKVMQKLGIPISEKQRGYFL